MAARGERPSVWTERHRYAPGVHNIFRHGAAHWGLAENKPNEDDPSKKHTGFWRITRRGRRFVQGRIRIPSHVYLYDNERWGMTTETKVNIEDALGEPFDYQELMEAS